MNPIDPPAPPDPPSKQNEETTNWAEYFRRYDRYLDLYERQLTEYIAKGRLDNNINEQNARSYERLVELQRRHQRWGAIIGITFIAGLVIAGIVAAVLQK